MNRFLKHILFTLLLGSVQAPLFAQVVNLAVPDTLGKRGDTLRYPIYALNALTTQDSVYSGEFTVSYNSTIIKVLDVERSGTVLGDGVDIVTFNSVTNRLAFTSTSPVTGSGVLIYLLVKVQANAPGSQTTIGLTNAMLNEGTPALNSTSGSLRPLDIFLSPKTLPSNLVVGDTIFFSVSGDIHPPVSWGSSDTNVVKINSATGVMAAKNIGQASVTVTDMIGLSDQTNLFTVFPKTLQSLTLRVRDTSITQNLVFDLPIYITDVTSLGILSAKFSLSFNQNILIPQGVVTAGTMSNNWISSVNYQTGKVIVALAGADTLQGSGVLAYIRFKVARFASFGTSLTFSNVLFNENIPAGVVNGFFSPITGPTITISGKPAGIIGGETAVLSVSGGASPYKWKMLSDTTIAAIDSLNPSTALFRAKKRGHGVFTAIDANGFDGFDSIFVSDFRASIADTSVKHNDSVDVPLLFSNVSGLEILSTQFKISYDTTHIRLASVVQTGTMSNGMALAYKDSFGNASFAFSGITPLSGSGTFVTLRFKPKGISAANSTTQLLFTKFDANEGGPTYRYATTKNGSLFVQPPPNTPPVFVNKLRDTTISENQLLSFQFTATDAENDTRTFSLVTSSLGMNITSTGLFTWTPNFTQSGQHKVVVQVSDGKANGITKDSAIITVNDVNRLPVFTRVMGDTIINEDQQLTFDVDATDPDGDVVRYFVQSAPTGMTMDSVSGVLSWRPTFLQSGVYPIVIRARDSKNASTTKNVSITVNNVNRAPLFTRKLPDTSIVANTLLQYQYLGNDPDGQPVQFSLVEAPSGAAISAAGVLQWTPLISQTGNFRIIVGLTDGVVTISDTAFVTVIGTNYPPVMTTSLNDTIISENQHLVFMYAALDPDNDPLTWSLVAAPSGVAISSAGQLLWTPTYFQSGTHKIIVSVSDNWQAVNDTAIVTVLNVNRPPVFTATLGNIVLGIDSAFTFQYAAADPDSEQLTFSFVKSKSNALLTSNGLFTWTPLPEDLGVDTFVVAVTDGSVSVLDTAFITVFGFPRAHISQMFFDFGSLSIGGTKTLTAKIKNFGYTPLIINSLPSPVANPNFTFDSSLIQIIAPGDSQSFSITFAPISAGTHGTLFTFSTNDPLMPIASITAQGTSVAKAALKKKILVDRMHHNNAMLNDSIMGFGGLFSFAQQSGISVSFADTGLHPHGFDILLLIAPVDLYTPNEISRIRTFVTNGGLLVALGAGNTASGTALNSILQDTLWTTGLSVNNNFVTDTVSKYLGNSTFLSLTQFADTNHPYLKGVDTLVFMNSASISVTGSAVPFLRTSPFGRATVVPDSIQPAVIGLSKVGKGKILAIGSTEAWTVLFPGMEISLGIFAQDNLQFAMNVFSITEDYEVKMPAPTPNETYQLVSIPFDLGNADIGAVLKQTLGEVNPLVWRLFGKFNPAVGTYAEFPSAGFNSFRRGEAYWLITRGQFNLNFGSATVLPAQDFFPIKVGPGYSMIGNPFPYKVSWANSIKGDSVQQTLYWFNPATNSFAAETQTMDPFKGYFVKNLSHDTVTIYINPQDVSSSLSKQESMLSFNEHEWRISIGASSGKARDSENYAGVSPYASMELDKLDAGEPPSTPTDYIVVCFNNSWWKKHSGNYAVDIRPVADEGVFWDLDVTTAKKQAKVALSLSSLGNLPSDFIVYLIDKKAERAVPVERNSVYDFTMGKNESRREFRLVAGKKEFVESNTGGIPLAPKEFALGQNFPNPFNPSTTIRYTIGHSGDVSITIYNVLGQKIRTLMNGFHSIGSYDIEWDGKDDHGLGVATGVYFYRITVKSQGEQLFNETKKAVLMK